jgi:hypothetical protein
MKMPTRDQHGLELTGASPAAAELFHQACRAYHCYAGDPLKFLDAATADSPGFVMAYVLKAHLTLIGSDADTAALGAAAFEAAKDLPATRREQGHLAAVGSVLAGEIRAAARILEDVSIEEPRDVLALQTGQTLDFLLGDSRMLRDRITRALPAWDERRPDYHAVLGLLAFGLEETGLYDRAEAAGRRAVELEPRNGWAQHAVAHVLEMQDRRLEGVAWMRADTHAWSHESFFQVHNWWHLALFHLGLDETDEALRLFDGPIFGTPSTMSFNLIDAAALLWRLSLQGVDVAGRWNRVAAMYAAQPRGLYAFDDAHAMMAFVGAGRDADADALLAAQTAALQQGGDNVDFVRDAGLPVMQAIQAYGAGDFARCTELLRGVRNHAARFGGSHAQRDLLDLTLIASAQKSGDASLERAHVAERAAAIPGASPARRLAA